MTNNKDNTRLTLPGQCIVVIISHLKNKNHSKKKILVKFKFFIWKVTIQKLRVYLLIRMAFVDQIKRIFEI